MINKITVKDESETTQLQVKIADFCSHYLTERETITINDGTDDERAFKATTCQHCNAWLMETNQGNEWIL